MDYMEPLINSSSTKILLQVEIWQVRSRVLGVSTEILGFIFSLTMLGTKLLANQRLGSSFVWYTALRLHIAATPRCGTVPGRARGPTGLGLGRQVVY